MSSLTLADLRAWHADLAQKAALRADNWKRSAESQETANPVGASRHRQCQAFALEEQRFHQQAASLLTLELERP